MEKDAEAILVKGQSSLWLVVMKPRRKMLQRETRAWAGEYLFELAPVLPFCACRTPVTAPVFERGKQLMWIVFVWRVETRVLWFVSKAGEIGWIDQWLDEKKRERARSKGNDSGR